VVVATRLIVRAAEPVEVLGSIVLAVPAGPQHLRHIQPRRLLLSSVSAPFSERLLGRWNARPLTTAFAAQRESSLIPPPKVERKTLGA
jgi:hypothetical protein